MDTLLGYLHDLWQFLVDHVLWPFEKLWAALLGALGDLVAAIPVPSGISSALSHLGGLPTDVLWFLGLMQFPAGLTMVMGAYMARWLLRRIPFVG